MWPGDQGQKNGDYQIKFLADRIVFAPFWYSQKMLSESHQPNVVGGYHQLCSTVATTTDEPVVRSGTGQAPMQMVTQTSSECFTDWMAAVSDDGNTLVIRTENPNNVSVAFMASIAGCFHGHNCWAPTASVVTLAGPSLDAMNDYDTPTAVVPKNSSVELKLNLLSTQLPPFSFVVFTLTKA